MMKNASAGHVQAVPIPGDQDETSMAEPQDPGLSSRGSARRSSLKRVVVIHDDPALRETVRSRLARDGRYRVESMTSAAIQHRSVTLRYAEAILLGLGAIRSQGRRRAQALDDLRRSAKVLLLLQRSELVQALDITERCDGFVFVDLNLDRLGDITDLALWGYCLIPPSVLTELTSQQLRLDLISELTGDELQVLALIGRGMTNRTIAEYLQLPETTVKNIVRSVLRKLRFRNRTEAAVFAFLHRASIGVWGTGE